MNQVIQVKEQDLILTPGSFVRLLGEPSRANHYPQRRIVYDDGPNKLPYRRRADWTSMVFALNGNLAPILTTDHYVNTAVTRLTSLIGMIADLGKDPSHLPLELHGREIMPELRKTPFVYSKGLSIGDALVVKRNLA